MPDLMTTQDRTGYFIITVEGRFSVPTIASIQRGVSEALEKKHKVIVFDLAQTTEFDSTGVSILTQLYKDITPKGGEICVAAAPDRLRRTMEITGVNSVVRHFDTLKAVEEEFESPVRTEDRGFYFYVRIPETFDILVVQPLRAEIDQALAAGHKNILFDLTDTEQITSVGIGVLMNIRKKMGRQAGGIFLLGVGANVSAVLYSTNVAELLPRFDSIEKAEEQLI